MRPFISLCLPVSMKDSLSFWCFVFLLHCLIYKVQTAHSQRSFSIPHSAYLVKYFFQLSLPFHSSEWFQPESFKHRHPVALARANFYILPRGHPFVKYFFELFSNFFVPSPFFTCLASRARLIYQISPHLSTLFAKFPDLFLLLVLNHKMLFSHPLGDHYFFPLCSSAAASRPLKRRFPLPKNQNLSLYKN